MIHALLAFVLVSFCYLAYRVGERTGRVEGRLICLAQNDGDTPSGAEVRR